MHAGRLNDPAVRESLKSAQGTPDEWRIYLVHDSGDIRTPAQNRLYRSLLRALAQQHGGSVEHWNNELVERFLGWEEVQTEDGDWRQVRTSTSRLSVKEFGGFLDACIIFAQELHVFL